MWEEWVVTAPAYVYMVHASQFACAAAYSLYNVLQEQASITQHLTERENTTAHRRK